MDPNQENQGEGSAGDNRQAIFTPQPEQPEVVPTAEVPTQPSVDLSHPYFSNHPTQTFNTDVGDIILNTGAPRPKQNKRPFIIGGIILAAFAVICVVVLLVVQAISKPSKADVAKSFDDYYQFLTQGPEDLDYPTDDDTWFLFTLQDDGLPAQEQADYLRELQQKLQKVKNDLGQKNNLSEQITYYSSLLYMISTYNNLETITNELEGYAISNDEKAAEDYIEGLLPETTGAAKAMSNTMEQYLLIKLAIYDTYYKNGCLLEKGNTDMECVIGLSDSYPELAQRAQETTRLYNLLEKYYDTVKTTFRSETERLQEALRGSNG